MKAPCSGAGRSVFALAVRSVARARSRHGRSVAYDQSGPPFVIVRRRALQDQAGVVGGAAADYASSERTIVLTSCTPVVGEHELARVEQLNRPALLRVGAVIRPRLDQTDSAGRILRQPIGQDTARASATDDQDVVALSHAADSTNRSDPIPRGVRRQLRARAGAGSTAFFFCSRLLGPKRLDRREL